MPMTHKPVRASQKNVPPVRARVRSVALQTMNERELGAIFCLFEWVASEQDTAPETVRTMTETHFETEDVTGMPSKDYDEVIRFLMDLRIDEMRH
jgi:hypothetical protein